MIYIFPKDMIWVTCIIIIVQQHPPFKHTILAQRNLQKENEESQRIIQITYRYI